MQCKINFLTRVNPKLGTEGIDYKILYKFGENEQFNNTYIVRSDSYYPNGLSISTIIIYKDNNILSKLELENEYFIWDNIKINQDIKYENGQKGVIVKLFGWSYEDIGEECQFLNKAGYLGVKISPPNEAILTYDIVEEDELNPWWYFLQPVSYKLESRLGNKRQLKDMINICQTNNIRIYSQAIINHMAGNGNDMYEIHKNGDCSRWGAKTGSAGSPYWTTKGRYENNPYTGNIPVIEFPSVPYFPSDFHCYLSFNNEYDIYQLNYHWINESADLNTWKDYVQQRIADFMTELLSIGISGISIVNSRHVSPDDYASIFEKLKKNLGVLEFPEDFIVILELSYENIKNIILSDDGEYSFGEPFTQKLKNKGLTDNDINKIKLGNEEPDSLPIYENSWKISQSRHVMSFENYNIQKVDFFNDFSYIITKDIDIHRNKTMDMLKRNDIEWKIKIIFSSYSLNESSGFPDGKSDCSKCNTKECQRYCTKSVTYSKAYDPLSKGYDAGNNSDNWKNGVYTRIHGDIKIINSMREWMKLNPLTEEELYKKEEKLDEYNCTENSPFIIIETGLCSMECSVTDFFNKICKIKNEDSQIAKDVLIKNIEKEIIDGSINELLMKVIMEEKNDLIVKTNNVLYQITSSYNQNNKKYSDISSIELGDCEEILKEKYNISNNDTLIILKVEYSQEGLLFPIIEYELFHPITKEKLNLDYCSDTKINLLIPVSIDEENLDKYNTSSDYYNNKCSPSTTQNSTDITLKDRAIEYINNNLSLCEINCEYSGYDSKYKKVKCNCQAKNKFEYIFKHYNFDQDKLMNNFKNIKDTLNLIVFHCYYVLFTKDGFTKNIGNFFILSILIIYFFLRNIFFVKGYDSFKIKIFKIMKLSNLARNMDNINNDKSINNTLNNDINNNENNDAKNLIENIKPKRKSKFKINNKRKVNMTEIGEMKDNKNIIIINNDEIGNRPEKGINIYCKKDDNNTCIDENFKNGCISLKEQANHKNTN